MRNVLLIAAVLLVVMGAAAAAGAAEAPGNKLNPGSWSVYGGDPGGSRYSPLTQITPANVGALTVAWTLRTGELGQGVKDWDRSAFEATPILYQGTLYLTTPSTDVLAVDAASGALRWRHASGSRKDLHYSDGVSRGVSLWVDPDSAAEARCHARIYAPVLDGRLLALDADSGALCTDFGKNGTVDLLQGVRLQWQEGEEWRNYLVTSPPAVIDGKVIVSSSIGDNRAVVVELGTVRAFAARTGALVWSPRVELGSNPARPAWPAWPAWPA